MKTVTLNGNVLELHDDITEIVITRFQALNRYAVVDAGVGADIASFDLHLQNIVRLAIAGDNAGMKKEVENIRQCLHLVLSGHNPELLSFACMVHSVNGVACTGESEPELTAVLKQLARKGLTIGKVRMWAREVKKKLTAISRFFSQIWHPVRESANTSQR